VQWDPAQYDHFADERTRPFLDLLARIPVQSPRRIVDLGCGTGAPAALMARRWPSARIEGIDSSPAMIDRAQRLGTDRLTFHLGDVATWRPDGDVDVIISNATLQWVPGHWELLRRWAGAVPVGGCLAFAVPANFDAPSHVLMREMAESPRWRDRLAGVLRHHDSVRRAPDYGELLLDAGLDIDVWETTYLHRLSGADPVLDWVRGTGLRPVLERLAESDTDVAAAEFEQEYGAQLRAAYPSGPHGTLFPFRRIFAVGHR
jgi:trans-aconitate 2-methyltransferase